jgi:hypothetical protein
MQDPKAVRWSTPPLCHHGVSFLWNANDTDTHVLTLGRVGAAMTVTTNVGRRHPTGGATGRRATSRASFMTQERCAHKFRVLRVRRSSQSRGLARATTIPWPALANPRAQPLASSAAGYSTGGPARPTTFPSPVLANLLACPHPLRRRRIQAAAFRACSRNPALPPFRVRSAG